MTGPLPLSDFSTRTKTFDVSDEAMGQPRLPAPDKGDA